MNVDDPGRTLGTRARGAAARLRDRDREVLVLLAKGLTRAEIADRLWVSESTVKRRIRALCQWMGARNRAHAVSLAYARGLLPGGRKA